MFLADKYAQKLKRDACDANTITICHTRSSTQGLDQGHSGAHPFIVEEKGRQLIGVHNGNLTGWNYKTNGRNYQVDSEWALNHIFDNGMEAFKDFNGAYAFVWWDSEDPDTLNMATNGERPMNICPIKGRGLYYASESGMLRWLLERRSITKEQILYLKPHNWYKFSTKDIGVWTMDEIKKPAVSTASTYNNTRSAYVAYTPVQYTTYKTQFDKVKERLEAIKEAKKNKSLTLVGSKSTIDATREALADGAFLTQLEIDEAEQMELVGATAIFTPTNVDKAKETIEGDVEIGQNIICFGIIRGVKDTANMLAKMGTEPWSVKVLGVSPITDSANLMTVICSKPRITMMLPASNAMH